MKKISYVLIKVLILAFIISLILCINVFAAETFEVSTKAELNDATTQIRNSEGGEYEIIINQDISEVSNLTFSKGITTIIGNGHEISGVQTIGVSNGATLNLGKNDGSDKLTISGIKKNDDPGILYITSKGICNMYEGVTLKDRETSNYFGGGATVQNGTFNMYGGTISNCGVKGGSVCYGGGVALISGGIFNMNGGTIENCYVDTEYFNESDKKEVTAVGGGVFVSQGSTFTMNGGTIKNNTATNLGGGVALDNSISELWSVGAYGYPKSRIEINAGTISGNKASNGAGIYASGYYYSYGAALCTLQPGIGNSDKPGLAINGGTIASNEAQELGGGILVLMLRPTLDNLIHNAQIVNNKADQGAGICVYGYWSETDIESCTISGNTATSNGGGIVLLENTSSSGTKLKNSIVTANTSGDFGAGVYYDAGSKLSIGGCNTIQDNKFNGKLNNLNIYGNTTTISPVYIIDSLVGSKIGISDPRLWNDNLEDEDENAVSFEYLTSGYNATNPEKPNNNPTKYFTSDHNTWRADYGANTVKTEKVTSYVSQSWSAAISYFTVYKGPSMTSGSAGSLCCYVDDENKVKQYTTNTTGTYRVCVIKYKEEYYKAFNKGGRYYVIEKFDPSTFGSSFGGTYFSVTNADETIPEGYYYRASNPSGTSSYSVYALEETEVSTGNDYSSEVRLVRLAVKYTLHYNDGVTENTIEFYNYDDPTTLIDPPTRDGYIFKGWFMKEDFSGDSYSQTPNENLGDVHYFAKWEKIEEPKEEEKPGSDDKKEDPKPNTEDKKEEPVSQAPQESAPQANSGSAITTSNPSTGDNIVFWIIALIVSVIAFISTFRKEKVKRKNRWKY